MTFGRTIESAEEELHARIDDIATERETTLSVGTAYRLFEPIIAFKQSHHHVSLRTTEHMTNSQLAEAVTDGRLDIAFFLADGPTPAELVCDAVFSDELTAILPKGHPLATRKSINLAALAEEDWVMLSEETPDTQFLLVRCAEVGFSPTIALTVGKGSTIVDDVAAGLGVGVLMKHSAKQLDTRGVAVLPLDPPIPHTPVACHKKSYSKLAQEFQACVTETLRNPR